MKPPQLAFESIDVLKRKLTFSEPVDTVHDVQDPASCRHSFFAQKKHPVPRGKHFVAWCYPLIFDQEDFPRLRNPFQKNVGADPAWPASVAAERIAFFHCFRDKKILGDDKEIKHEVLVCVVIQDKEIRVVAASQPFDFRSIRTVGNFFADFSFRTFQLIALAAVPTVKVCDRLVVRVFVQVKVSAARAED